MQQRGSTFLDLALFTPLALLFIALLVDGGLLVTDRAAVQDALRASLFEYATRPDAPLLTRPTSGGGEIRVELGEQVLTNVQAALTQRLEHAFSLSTVDAPASFRTTVALVAVSFNPATGALLSPPEVVLQKHSQNASLLETLAPNLHPRTLPEYLAREFVPAGGLPLGAKRFYLVGEVRALSRGVFHPVTHSLLGSLPALQQFEAVPLRGLMIQRSQ
jgi:hypothetical protein